MISTVFDCKQCFLLPIMAVDGELILINSILPSTIEYDTAILVTPTFLALHRAHALQCSNVSVNW